MYANLIHSKILSVIQNYRTDYKLMSKQFRRLYTKDQMQNL